MSKSDACVCLVWRTHTGRAMSWQKAVANKARQIKVSHHHRLRDRIPQHVVPFQVHVRNVITMYERNCLYIIVLAYE